MKKQLIVATALITLASILNAAEDFKDTRGKHLDIMRDGKPVVRYMYEFDRSTPEKTHETYKVYHHVMDPDGSGTLTKGAGHQYTHHRGIYIGWNKVGHKNKHADLWHLKSGEAIKHNKILKQEADKNKSVLSTRIDWLMKDGIRCIEEIRTVTVHHTDKDAHVLLDFESELKAIDGNVSLKGDPEHAGCQYRPHQEVSENKSAKYIFHKDGINPKKDLNLPWVAESHEIRGKKYTVQHMSHPDNPKGSKYSAYRDYGRFGNFLTADIKDGESLKLKYRIRITAGDAPTREVMAKRYEEFVR